MGKKIEHFYHSWENLRSVGRYRMKKMMRKKVFVLLFFWFSCLNVYPLVHLFDDDFWCSHVRKLQDYTKGRIKKTRNDGEKEQNDTGAGGFKTCRIIIIVIITIIIRREGRNM